MTDLEYTAHDLESYLKPGFGEHASSLELDCLALATCFDKKNPEHAARAKLAKKVLKKHASDAVSQALSMLSRRNYFPTNKTDNYGEVIYTFKTLTTYFDDDFAALTELDGFDHMGFVGRLASLHHQVARHILERDDLALFEAYFASGHVSDALTFDDVIETNGRYFGDRAFAYSKEQLAVLAQNPRFTALELHFKGADYLLPDDLSAWENLESLTISADDVTSMTQEQLDAIAALPALTRLKLSMGLESLPEELSGLAKLTHLELVGNSLSELPESLSSLTELVELDLRSNEFSTFPPPIAALSKLRVLNLGRNWKLEDVPDGIGELHALEELYVWGTSVSSFSRRIAELENLRELSVSGHKNTDDLFAVLGELQSLKTLYLAQMDHITELPDAIGELRGLEKLHIANLDNLESWFDGLGNLTNLVELRLEHICWMKGIKTLPKGIGKLKNLEILSFGWTSLQGQFPNEVVKCKKLRELDLGTCGIGAPPKNIGELENLEILDMTGVSIKSFPDSFFDLGNLKKLDLSGGSLPDLPDDVRRLESLEHLDIGWTTTGKLPDAIIELENLRFLRVSRNGAFGEFPPNFESMTNLTRVLCRDCDRDRILPAVRELKKKMKWCKFAVNG